MAQQIQLTKGYVATVDDDLYPGLAILKWHAIVNKRGVVYGARHGYVGEKRTLERMSDKVKGAVN